ncbi:Uncharacterised protein g5569 [Pycnogonum litorale]
MRNIYLILGVLFEGFEIAVLLHCPVEYSNNRGECLYYSTFYMDHKKAEQTCSAEFGGYLMHMERLNEPDLRLTKDLDENKWIKFPEALTQNKSSNKTEILTKSLNNFEDSYRQEGVWGCGITNYSKPGSPTWSIEHCLKEVRFVCQFEEAGRCSFKNVAKGLEDKKCAVVGRGKRSFQEAIKWCEKSGYWLSTPRNLEQYTMIKEILINHKECTGMSYGNRCFFSMNMEASHTVADYTCRKNGGRLAMPHNKDDGEIIHRMCAEMSFSSCHIGIKRQVTDRLDDPSTLHWIYITGDEVPNEDINFDNAHDNSRLKCVGMSILSGMWHTVRCFFQKLMFICEKDMLLHKTIVGDKAYYTNAGSNLDYEDAEKYCATKNGTLAIPTSPNINDVIQEICNGTECYIGLNLPNAETDVIQTVTNFTNFGGGQNIVREPCVKMNGDGKWYGERCSERLLFVCEKTVNLEIWNGIYASQGKFRYVDKRDVVEDFSLLDQESEICPYIYAINEEIKWSLTDCREEFGIVCQTIEQDIESVGDYFIVSNKYQSKYIDTFGDCEVHGGKLATSTSQTDNEIIDMVCSKHEKSKKLCYVESMWTPDAAVNVNNEHFSCFTVNVTHHGPQVITNCDEIRPFVCQKYGIEEVDNFFSINNNPAFSFKLASTLCVLYGGTLAISKDWKTANISKQLCTHHDKENELCYIGVVRHGDHLWKHTDGSSIEKYNFAAQQPNGMFGKDDCIAINRNDEWYGVSCEEPLPFICSKVPGKMILNV